MVASENTSPRKTNEVMLTCCGRNVALQEEKETATAPKGRSHVKFAESCLMSTHTRMAE